MDDIFHKLLILRTYGIGSKRYKELLDGFGTAKAASESLNHPKEHIDSVLREMDRALHSGIFYICDDSDEYPANLKLIENRPPVISVRGNIKALQKPAVGMVGTRHATAAGMRFIHELAREFASRGYIVVSGMAMGTDTAAHDGGLAAPGNLNTIAVLAGGVDYVWPPENERLYNQIIERGAIVSDLPVGTTPVASNFIMRNRWIAGISEKLILGEADEKSGSMATAGFALGYGRIVHAIPGHPSDSRSAGPNRLIKDGRAEMCLGIDDFFESQKKDKKVQKIENEVLDKLGMTPVAESVLAELVKKNIADVRRELVMLELCGAVKKTDGGYVKI
ncbi:MAG: DNA-processing protein DprA [Alphaproteobacteria bacterium]|nr:DNA-processing protein DprA [Alphaproteobacteria bacterium]